MAESHSRLDAPTVCPDDRSDSVNTAVCPQFPRRFGQYELLEEVARGGMGVVFRARQVDLNRVVAVKMILDGHFADSGDVRRFLAEAEAAANLDHPGIVPIYEVGEFEGRKFFSMAFVRGESLAQRLARGPLDASAAARLVADVADAIDYAHRQGIIHRDLKPGNVLIDQREHYRVTDFGVAKQIRDDRDLTIQGELLGTPSYMPPEQASGSGEITFASDVYSLGAILYTALTGRPPFQSANQLDTIHQVMYDEVIPPRRLNSQIPRDLETITLKCLEKTPARRYQMASEVADDLRCFLSDQPISARPPGTFRVLGNWFRSNLLVASMSGITTLALTVGMVGLAYRCRMAMNEHASAVVELTEMKDRADQNSLLATMADMQRRDLERRWRLSESERLAYAAQGSSDATLAVLLATEACEQLGTDLETDSLARIVLEELLEDSPAAFELSRQSPSQLVAIGKEVAGREWTEAERKQFHIPSKRE